MKKTLSIIAALVLALGMTQCKKAEKPQASTGDPIHVTFTATYGGERTSFNPEGGSFTWSSGVTEYIYVGGSTSGYLGTLSATGNGLSTLTFTGDITPSDGETLHFFYLGKGKNGSAVTSLDFSSQDGTLENLTNYHIAVGSQTYTEGMTDFSAYLRPLVAFAYFDLSGFGAETVSFLGDGVYSKATINYQNGTIAGNVKGNINVGTASNEKYVALIPSTSVSSTDYATTVEFGSTGYMGSLRFERGIFAGRYYTANGNALVVEATSAGPAVYSVGSSTKVQFSSGNLYYSGTVENGTWGFESTPQYSQYTNNVYANLFNFGATGKGNGKPIYTTDKYVTSNLSLANGTDWGDCANDAQLGGYSNWRTPTFDEWKYLFQSRLNASSHLGVGQVDGIHGLILLPDNWIPSTPFITGFSGSWENNSYTQEEWNVMSNKGAAFLPAAGERGYNNPYISNMKNRGEYWSSTNRYSGSSRSMHFINSTVLNLGSSDYYSSYCGLSVRLVRDVQ